LQPAIKPNNHENAKLIGMLEGATWSAEPTPVAMKLLLFCLLEKYPSMFAGRIKYPKVIKSGNLRLSARLRISRLRLVRKEI
jgi:hypothetical protein